MCTAFRYVNDRFVFGRNMDIECGFGEKIVLLSSEYTPSFRYASAPSHPKMIMGVASVIDDTPLFAEGFNEDGLCIAGLNFPHHHSYASTKDPGKENLCPFEVIPYILSHAATVKEAVELFRGIHIVDESLKEGLPVAPMHFFVADREGAYVVEPVDGKIHIYENPHNLLTNNPEFPFHVNHLANYAHLSPKTLVGEAAPYGEGLSTVGLPGDLSPMGRFVRCHYTLHHSLKAPCVNPVIEAFHILDTVKMVRGTVITQGDRYDITTYSIVIDVEKMTYYVKSYDHLTVAAYAMKKCEEPMRVYDFLQREDPVPVLNA